VRAIVENHQKMSIDEKNDFNDQLNYAEESKIKLKVLKLKDYD
jgi:hypothetical protein